MHQVGLASIGDGVCLILLLILYPAPIWEEPTTQRPVASLDSEKREFPICCIHGRVCSVSTKVEVPFKCVVLNKIVASPQDGKLQEYFVADSDDSQSYFWYSKRVRLNRPCSHNEGTSFLKHLTSALCYLHRLEGCDN